jgi:glycosyltransferase involved in cell wall biosynthesis
LKTFRDPRIRIHHADRLGQARAKNLGIDLSRGEFVAFLDADDVWLPTKLMRQISLMTDDVGVVYSKRLLINENSQPFPQKRESSPGRGDIRTSLFVRNGICFSSAVVRRPLFDRVGRFDESIDLSIDYDFWLRAARVTHFDFVDEPLVKYRTGHANLSRNLDDRVATACSIMDRAVRRGGYEKPTVAAGYADTCRTLAYVLRKTRPWESLAWSLRAFAWPHQRLATLKGIVGTLLARFRPAVS